MSDPYGKTLPAHRTNRGFWWGFWDGFTSFTTVGTYSPLPRRPAINRYRLYRRNIDGYLQKALERTREEVAQQTQRD